MMSKSRLEAFSDGVIAIAITLLVLDIKVPPPHEGTTLAHQLADQWPRYAAYVISFLTIGVIWINHHAMLRRLRAVDHVMLELNLLLLLTVGILPWSTALMAEYLREPRGQHLAAAVYAGSFLLMAVAFYALQRQVLSTKAHLLRDGLSEADRRRLLVRGRAGLVPYAVATAAAPISSYLTLALCAVIAAFYALPGTTSDPVDDLAAVG